LNGSPASTLLVTAKRTKSGFRGFGELGDEPNRQAQFVCAVAIARPDGAIILQELGVCKEKFSTPRGTGGFATTQFYVPAYQILQK